MKNYWISFITAGPTTSQLDWKKLAEKPSGPGALSPLIAKVASVIYFAWGIAINSSFFAFVMQGARASHTVCLLSELEERKRSV